MSHEDILYRIKMKGQVKVYSVVTVKLAILIPRHKTGEKCLHKNGLTPVVSILPLLHQVKCRSAILSGLTTTNHDLPFQSRDLSKRQWDSLHWLSQFPWQHWSQRLQCPSWIGRSGGYWFGFFHYMCPWSASPDLLPSLFVLAQIKCRCGTKNATFITPFDFY